MAVTWWGYVDLNHGPLPYQVMPSGSVGPGTASYQALRWHTLAQTSLNWHRRAPFCPSKCPSSVRPLRTDYPPRARDDFHLHQRADWEVDGPPRAEDDSSGMVV